MTTLFVEQLLALPGSAKKLPDKKMPIIAHAHKYCIISSTYLTAMYTNENIFEKD